jgi:hypothetical protein
MVNITFDKRMIPKQAITNNEYETSSDKIMTYTLHPTPYTYTLHPTPQTGVCCSHQQWSFNHSRCKRGGQRRIFARRAASLRSWPPATDSTCMCVCGWVWVWVCVDRTKHQERAEEGNKENGGLRERELEQESASASALGCRTVQTWSDLGLRVEGFGFRAEGLRV